MRELVVRQSADILLDGAMLSIEPPRPEIDGARRRHHARLLHGNGVGAPTYHFVMATHNSPEHIFAQGGSPILKGEPEPKEMVISGCRTGPGFGYEIDDEIIAGKKGVGVGLVTAGVPDCAGPLTHVLQTLALSRTTFLARQDLV